MDGDSNGRLSIRLLRSLLLLASWGDSAYCIVGATFVVLSLGSIAAGDEPQLGSVPRATEFATTSANAGKSNDFLDVDAALDRRGSVTFRKTALSEVVFMLSELWKVNIVAGADVTGEVSGTFHDAPLREVLGAILTANNYGYRRNGHSIIVLPIDRIGSEDPNFISQTLTIGAPESDATLDAAKLLLSPGGQLRPVGVDKILVIDLPDRVARVRELLASVNSVATISAPPSQGQPTTSSTQATPLLNLAPGSAVDERYDSGIAYFSPQYSDALPLSASLTAALGDSVTVAVFAEENRIMVLGTPEQLRLATDAIAHLDVPRTQVRIRALIYDVGLSELEALGFDWSHGANSGSALAAGTTGLGFKLADTAVLGGNTLPLVGSAAEGSNFVFQSVRGSLNVASFINALDNTAGAKLLADPTITVTDRSEASIKIVQKIPVANTSQLGGTTTAVTSVTFQEAGITLNVIPRISRDATIQLQVKPEYSVLVGTSSQNGAPIIDSRTASTVVRVADKQMFVLGGLRQNSATEIVKGVPFLKDVRFVGKLFRSHRTEIRQSELIVFLQPEIIDEYNIGSPRQQLAACIGNNALDQIPVADNALFIPDCRDCQCPYHHPRPRVNSGSSSLEMIGESGMNHECSPECNHNAANEVFIEDVALPSPVIDPIVNESAPVHVARPASSTK